MKCLLSIVFVTSLLAGPGGLCQDRPQSVSLIQLIANPEKFDGKVVAVEGFLVLGDHPHPDFIGQQPSLYLHREDAENLLSSNSVRVEPSDPMLRDHEKFNRMYVALTGLFRAGAITHVQACTAWSDPNHPIGLKGDNGKYK